MPEQPKIALVGHCAPDFFMLRSAVSRFVPGSNVVSIESPTDLESDLENFDVLLVNRVLDGGFERSDGVDLIVELAKRGVRARMLLISDIDDAQSAAESAGAMPGFGKQDLYDDSSRERLMNALEAVASNGGAG